MEEKRISRMAAKVVETEEGVPDEPLEMVDQAIDTIIASIKIIDENLPKVKPNSVPEKAALDEAASIMDEGFVPYFGDFVKQMGMFD